MRKVKTRGPASKKRGATKAKASRKTKRSPSKRRNKMKRIEAIVRPSKAGDVIDALEKVGHPGMMVTEIEGHGKQKGLEETVRGKKYKVDLITKTRIEIVVKEADVEKMLSAIRKAAFTGEIGDGKIFLHPVDDALRIRTDERGEVAV